MRTAEALGTVPRQDLYSFLYEHNLPAFFLTHAETNYGFGWRRIMVDLRDTRFFYPGDFASYSANITGEYLNDSDAVVLGEALLQALAALATTLDQGERVKNSLQLDGFQVDPNGPRLIALEGPISEAAEEDALNVLLRESGLPNTVTIRRHVADAQSLFVDTKHHPSLNESRNILQALVDEISAMTHQRGEHLIGLPGGTANRIKYLAEVGFFTADENSAFLSAWGALSAGSHPGVPDREEARIGLVLALEFGQLLLWKYRDWAKNAHRKFSK